MPSAAILPAESQCRDYHLPVGDRRFSTQLTEGPWLLSQEFLPRLLLPRMPVLIPNHTLSQVSSCAPWEPEGDLEVLRDTARHCLLTPGTSSTRLVAPSRAQ